MPELNPDDKINDLAPKLIDFHTARALGRIRIIFLKDLLGMSLEDFLSRSRRYGKPRRPGLARLDRKPHFGKKAEEKTLDFMRRVGLEFRQSV